MLFEASQLANLIRRAKQWRTIVLQSLVNSYIQLKGQHDLLEGEAMSFIEHCFAAGSKLGISFILAVVGLLNVQRVAMSQIGDETRTTALNMEADLQPAHTGQSKRNMVASVHPLATQAGVRALERGGNAVDAAVATALTLGVVDGYNSGIGGGCFILIRRADGSVVAIDGREMAPAAAHRDMYLRDGVADPKLSQTGALAIGVPGALAACHEAVTEFGRLPFAELVLPGAEIAEKGFAVTREFQGRLRAEQKSIALFPGSAAVLLHEDGSIYQEGEILKQSDLANTYRQIAEHGLNWFYQGPFAEQTEAWSRANGGIITTADFASYRTVRRTPIRTSYRGFEIIGFPPPSSGGVHVAQILNILENFELSATTDEEQQRSTHRIAEAMKLAFADRAYWLGDPDYVNVPRGLIDKAYAKSLAERISDSESLYVQSHGTPPNSTHQFFEKHTTHIAAADSEGNWVAITSTVNTTFGSKVIVPGLGVIMNNQMDDFSIAPGVPNAFGLVGAESNAVAAGKRPLSSMSPTIVLRDDQPVLTIGAAGGPTIISQVVWGIIGHLDFGKPIDQAVAAPRIHHQWTPNRLRVERSMEDGVQDSLKAKGHELDLAGSIGITQAISFDRESGSFTGVADPRTTGSAQGEK